ncbi:hypothetical protein FPV67DRAFT_1517859 [Lyophyllum atratum]|nr:hypothetical protein FPV67DRAFT_1517859 [Lyophyllum atratum]
MNIPVKARGDGVPGLRASIADPTLGREGAAFGRLPSPWGEQREGEERKVERRLDASPDVRGPHVYAPACALRTRVRALQPGGAVGRAYTGPRRSRNPNPHRQPPPPAARAPHGRQHPIPAHLVRLQELHGIIGEVTPLPLPPSTSRDEEERDYTRPRPFALGDLGDHDGMNNAWFSGVPRLAPFPPSSSYPASSSSTTATERVQLAVGTQRRTYRSRRGHGSGRGNAAFEGLARSGHGGGWGEDEGGGVGTSMMRRRVCGVWRGGSFGGGCGLGRW